MRVKTVIERCISTPGTVFLVDSIGAFLTGTVLILVVVPFSEAFGMPKIVLYCLSAVAYIFSIYSFCCSIIKSDQWPFLLKVISVANCVYCIATIVLMINFTDTITPLGFAYFTGEIIIVIGLVSLEILTIQKARRSSIDPGLRS